MAPSRTVPLKTLEFFSEGADLVSQEMRSSAKRAGVLSTPARWATGLHTAWVRVLAPINSQPPPEPHSSTLGVGSRPGSLLRLALLKKPSCGKAKGEISGVGRVDKACLPFLLSLHSLS